MAFSPRPESQPSARPSRGLCPSTLAGWQGWAQSLGTWGEKAIPSAEVAHWEIF